MPFAGNGGCGAAAGNGRGELGLPSGRTPRPDLPGDRCAACGHM